MDDNPYHPLFLTPEQIDAAKALDSVLSQPGTQLFGYIHSLAYALMSGYRSDVSGNQFECPNVVFLVFVNLRSDSTFETPETISKRLAMFSWAIRATAVQEALVHRNEFRDGMLGYVLFLSPYVC
jgi:hypothetical protein